MGLPSANETGENNSSAMDIWFDSHSKHVEQFGIIVLLETSIHLAVNIVQS